MRRLPAFRHLATTWHLIIRASFAMPGLPPLTTPSRFCPWELPISFRCRCRGNWGSLRQNLAIPEAFFWLIVVYPAAIIGMGCGSPPAFPGNTAHLGFDAGHVLLLRYGCWQHRHGGAHAHAGVVAHRHLCGHWLAALGCTLSILSAPSMLNFRVAPTFLSVRHRQVCLCHPNFKP